MPHFYDLVPDSLERLSHAEAVERYAAGATSPGEAIAGLSRAQLASCPVPGTWSIQQIVVHLMDSDLVASYRMKRTIAESNPRLDAYDETAFAQRLCYHEIDALDACELFRRNRLMTAMILRRLSAADFDRGALHPEYGPLTLGALVRCYVHHVDHHLKFLRDKRRMVEAAA